MEYTKITCKLSPDGELARELLVAELGDAGFESFVETDDAVEAFIPTRSFSEELLAEERFRTTNSSNFNIPAKKSPTRTGTKCGSRTILNLC